MQRIRWRRAAGLYVTSDGGLSQAAYVPAPGTAELGSRHIAEREAAKDLWRIDVPGGGAFVFSYSNADGSGSQYKVLPVTSAGYGAMQDGPLVDDFQAALDVAPNGKFMVANYGETDTGVFLWTGSTFAATPVDSFDGSVYGGVLHIKISPDSSTVILGLNGSPYVIAFPVSEAGFGTAYAAPASPPPDSSRGISWHPSGEAVALSWRVTTGATMSTAVWAWSGGWGSRYADPAASFGGLSAFPIFSPDGATLFIMRTVSGVIPADSADGQYRIYNFTLPGGMTTRVAASSSPIAGTINTNQSAYSGRLIVPGSKPANGLVTYTFSGGAIGPGVGHTGYVDPEDEPPEDGFIWTPFTLCFSRDGKFLLGFNQNGAPAGTGIARLFAVADDGTLTQIGPTFTDPFGAGWYKIAWREG